MKMLEHPNIVNLVEVIDDPETDHFYMGMLNILLPVGFSGWTFNVLDYAIEFLLKLCQVS